MSFFFVNFANYSTFIRMSLSNSSRVILSVFIASMMAMPLGAKVVRKYSSTPDATLAVKVDSVDFRNDLTRVYCKFSGVPHTSNRVDSAKLETGGNVYEGNDIDGVDFKRYFQWEDDGNIMMEIDFPAMKDFKFARLNLSTPRGASVTKITRK